MGMHRGRLHRLLRDDPLSTIVDGRRLVRGARSVRSSGSVGARSSAVLRHSCALYRFLVDLWASAQEMTTRRRSHSGRSHCLVDPWASAQETTTR